MATIQFAWQEYHLSQPKVQIVAREPLVATKSVSLHHKSVAKGVKFSSGHNYNQDRHEGWDRPHDYCDDFRGNRPHENNHEVNMVKRFTGRRNYQDDYNKALMGPCQLHLGPVTQWRIVVSSRISTHSKSSRMML